MHDLGKNDTCVFTVFYPEMEKWILEFTETLLKQDFLDFDLVIVNDGIDLSKLKLLDQKFNCKLLPPCRSIARNRNTGFAYLIKSGYRNVIFADSDDLMQSDRISTCRSFLQESEIVVNDLTIMSSNGELLKENYFGHRMGEKQDIHLSDILDHNMMGMSNTGLRAEILNGIIIPEEIEVVDWHLFTILLNRGHKTIFTSTTSTCYRQHDHNMHGFHRPDDKNIITLARNKYLHYYHLQHLSSYFNERAKDYDRIRHKLNNPDFREQYLKNINDQHPENPFWFECIKPDLI